MCRCSFPPLSSACASISQSFPRIISLTYLGFPYWLSWALAYCTVAWRARYDQIVLYSEGLFYVEWDKTVAAARWDEIEQVQISTHFSLNEKEPHGPTL